MHANLVITVKDSEGKIFVREWLDKADRRDAIRWTVESGDLPHYINKDKIESIAVTLEERP